MDDQGARRIESLFAHALELDPQERSTWLASLSGADGELRAELESLLVHLERSSRFLARPATDAAFLASRPERIASYRVLRELGAGGMGVVYLAEQDQPRREVALKVIRPGFTSRDALRRFEHEAAALARLHHPHIAQVFEAGTADWGFGPQPYFAMELVQGRTLSEHVRERASSVHERLTLLAQACDALEHAHGRGVVHRDLKPSNILVESLSDGAEIKVLDFGVARVTDVGAQSASRLTDAGQILGTLPYMSPEQARGDSLVDARSDVYALGAIGYELFAGEPPLDVLGRPLHEAVRIVCDTDPEALSNRGVRIDREIETILAKALDKDPRRRYGSAGEMAADLRRHMHHRPIHARPPSRTYRLAKFTRRHRALVSGLSLTFIALLGGLIATRNQAVVAAGERDRADVEARVARAVADFQRDMLARVDPEVDGREVRLADVLDDAAAALPGALAGLLAAEGGVRAMLGGSYQSLGLVLEAEEQLVHAVRLLTDAHGREHDETLRARGSLASVVADQGRYAESLLETEEVLRAWIARHGRRHPEALVLELNLAKLYALVDRAEDAERLARENLELRREVFGEDHEEFLNGLSTLGQLFLMQGRFAEAEPLLRQAIEQGRTLQGDHHPRTLQRSAEFASVLIQTQRLAEAEVLLRATIDAARTVFGTEHGETQAMEHNLGALLERRGHVAEAEAQFRKVIEIQGRLLDEAHPDAWTAQSSLAGLLFRQRRFQEAESLFARVLAVQERALGPDDPECGATRSWLERTRRELAPDD